MKRVLSICLCLVFALSFLLSGCKTSKNEPAAQSTVNQSEATANKYQLTKDKVTLTAFIHTRPSVDDYVNNDFTKWLEEQTNVHLEFIVAAETGDEPKQKLNLLLSSGDSPDINLATWTLNRDEINFYGKQGVIIPLNDMIDKNGVEVKKVFEKYPLAKDFVTLEDGKIYTMPYVSDAFHTSAQHKMWIYKPWLDKLSLKMPETTEEYYNVLKAFKELDPNGNGKKDEIPAAGCIQHWYGNPDSFLMNAFIYDDSIDSDRLWVTDGKVDVVYNKPEWKEGLKYIRKLVKEGLIAKESFTQGQEALVQIGENPDVNILGSSWGGYAGVFADMANSKRWLDWAIAPALKGPNGVRYATYLPEYPYLTGTFITNKCKNPEIAFRMLDLLYNMDVQMRKERGIPDRDWRWAKEGEQGISGAGVWVTLNSIEKIAKNTIWDQMGNFCEDEAFRVGEVIDLVNNPNEKILYDGTKSGYAPYFPSLENKFSPFILQTKVEMDELGVLSTQLRTYINEMTARFATGDVDIDKGWDGYLAQLDKLSMKRLIELKQAAYDRNKK